MKTLDLLTLGEIMLRLSAPSDERLVRGNTFLRQAGGAEFPDRQCPLLGRRMPR